MALDMRALYYVTLPDIKDAELYSETVKANENNLNPVSYTHLTLPTN